jgi:carboxypeptidase family protein/PDZ domain-containing protein
MVLLAIAFVVWRWPNALRPAKKSTATAPTARPSVRPPAPIRLSEATAAHDPAAIAGAIEGIVLSQATGAGVGGAELVFEHDGAAHTITAAADGTFRFLPKEAGAWRLAQVSAEGFLPWSPEWGQSPVAMVLRAGERISGVTIHLVPKVEYTGVVVDEAGKPAADVDVRQVEPAASERWTSDARGEFHFHAPDDAVLEATARDGRFGRGALDLRAQVSHRLRIRLGAAAPARGTIAGRVLDADGSPAAGAHVTASFVVEVVRRGIDRHPTRAAVAAADGRFTIDLLDVGPHRVEAVLQGRAPARVEPVATGTSDLELRLSAGNALRGVVRDQESGAPIAAFAIALERRGKGIEREPLTPRTFFDAQGRYEVRGLLPGKYAARAIAAGHAPSAEKIVEIASADASADFELGRGGRLRGTVRDAKTHQPLGGARISAEGQFTGGDDLVASNFDAVSRADGSFEIAGVSGSHLSVLIAAQNHHSRILSGLSADAPPVTVELNPTDPGEEPRTEFAGIGAQMTAHDDALVITGVIPGGGAAEAGFAPGDAIVTVEGQPVEPIGLAGAVQIIRGPEDSYVHLGVRKGNQPPVIEIPVRRKVIRF